MMLVAKVNHLVPSKENITQVINDLKMNLPSERHQSSLVEQLHTFLLHVLVRFSTFQVQS